MKKMANKNEMKYILAAILITICSGCASSHVVHGLEEGRKRDLGNGFYTIDTRQKNPDEHWDSGRWTATLFYKNTEIGNADVTLVSESRRFVLFCDIAGNPFLLDTQNKTVHLVPRPTVTKASGPIQFGPKEEVLQTKDWKVQISDLKILKEY